MSSMYETWSKNKMSFEFFCTCPQRNEGEKVDLIKQEIERKIEIRKCEFKVGCFALYKTSLVERCL